MVNHTKVQIKTLLAEYVAMTLFIYILCGTVMSYMAPPAYDYKNTPLGEQYHVQAELTFGVVVPLVGGCTILALIYAAAPYKAGQMNPSVSIALLVLCKQGLVQTSLMIVAQFLGSLTAVGLLTITIPNAEDSGYAANALAANVAVGNALLGEAVATFMLVIVVLQVINYKSAEIVAPIAIGFAVMIAHFLLLGIDGCSINTARSFGPAVASGQWDDFWVFVVGPIAGALVAAAVHALMTGTQEIKKDMQKEKDKDIEVTKIEAINAESSV